MAGLEIRAHTEGIKAIPKRLKGSVPKVEHAVAVQMESDIRPYVPMLTGKFRNDTKVRRNLIIYPGPFARYLYEGKVMVDAETGKGPSVYIDKKGNRVIKYKKGTKLKATEKNLVFTKTSPVQAGAHWDKAAKAQNMDKWEETGIKAVKKYGL